MSRLSMITASAIALALTAFNASAAKLSVDMVPGGGVDQNLVITDNPTFSVDILISDISDLAGFEFNLDFDGGLISADSITSGNLFGADTWPITSQINANSISFSETTFAAGLDITSPAILATVNFKAIGPGSSNLTLSSVVLSDSLAASIASFDTQNGNVYLAPVPLPPTFLLFATGCAWITGKSRLRTKSTPIQS